MKAKISVALVAALLLILLISVSVWAMASADYRLDWLVQSSGAGGGKSSSTSYVANYTIGQAATGSSSSVNYRAGLGYWYGAGNPYACFIPIIAKSN
jgi:hypothetical protein